MGTIFTKQRSGMIKKLPSQVNRRGIGWLRGLLEGQPSDFSRFMMVFDTAGEQKEDQRGSAKGEQSGE